MREEPQSIRTKSDDRRREEAAKQAARLMNRYQIPGVAPLTLLEKVEIVVLALVLALVLFGMIGIILPPPVHP